VEDLCDRVAIMFGGRVHAEGRCDELLVQEDSTTIRTDSLPDGVVNEIRGVLARHGIGHLDVERPRRRMESLFLEIVERARAQGTETSGARSGGQVAEFLRGDEAATRRDVPAVPAAAGAGVADAPGETAQPVDTGLIDSLINR
jgi:hypothetical protein